jgi:hypothetical protein
MARNDLMRDTVAQSAMFGAAIVLLWNHVGSPPADLPGVRQIAIDLVTAIALVLLMLTDAWSREARAALAASTNFGDW